MTKRCCDCRARFVPVNKQHRRCHRCSRARARTRLADLNARKARGEVLDRRRGIDINNEE